MPRNKPEKILNLRSLVNSELDRFPLQELVFKQIDSFLYPLFKNKNSQLNQKVKIIIGKGINSKNKIQGKAPIRYYTELYLNKLGIVYKEGDYFDGQDGVLIFYI